MIKITPIDIKDKEPVFINRYGWFPLIWLAWKIYRTYGIVEVVDKSETKFLVMRQGTHILTIEDAE